MALSRGTSTDYKDLLTKLDQFMVGDHVATVAIVSGGTGFAVGEIITLTDGTFTKAARFIVTSVSAGVITGIRIWDSGAYSVNPDLTATTSWTTSGSGTGATFDLTMEVSNWTKQLDDSTLDSSTERVVWWEETATGVVLGIRTYSNVDGSNTARNWMLFGASSWNGALPWYQQPDISPNGLNTGLGTVDTTPTNFAGMYLKNNDTFPMDYWFFVTSRRIIVMAKLFNGVITTPRYSSCYMGLLNPFGTSAEYPYPLYIAGSATDILKAWNANAPAFQMTGLTHVLGSSVYGGPGFYFKNDGNWTEVQNATYSTGASTRTALSQYVVLPVGQPNSGVNPDQNITIDTPSTTLQWENMLVHTGPFADSPTFNLMPTPDTGGEKRFLVPATLVFSVSPSDIAIVGEMDGVYWASALGTTQITPEDTVTDTPLVYRAFPNGTYLNADGLQLIRET